MAVTATKVTQTVIGDRRLHAYTVLMDSSYPTGGEPLTRTDLGFASTADDEFVVIPLPSAGYVPEYDRTNQKLKVYRGDNANASAAPGVEVSNAVDLSAVTFMVLAIGRFQQ